jgi:hypothetical protein
MATTSRARIWTTYAWPQCGHLNESAGVGGWPPSGGRLSGSLKRLLYLSASMRQAASFFDRSKVHSREATTGRFPMRG